MAKVKKILAPTDFSELSKRGIRYALEMARDSSAEVIVYHVIDLGDERPEERSHVGPYHDMLEDNRRVLEKFLSDGFADCIDLVEVRQIVEFGRSFKNIVEMADQQNVDIIVMATHGRTGLDHVILGSVAEKVVARSSRPVLVIPAIERAKGEALAA
jgi:nucleotide-binding universal stress UspA family protein